LPPRLTPRRPSINRLSRASVAPSTTTTLPAANGSTVQSGARVSRGKATAQPGRSQVEGS
jgi:hypothetical protein